MFLAVLMRLAENVLKALTSSDSAGFGSGDSLVGAGFKPARWPARAPSERAGVRPAAGRTPSVGAGFKPARWPASNTIIPWTWFGHDDPGVQAHARVVLGQRLPRGLGELPGVAEDHLAVHHVAKSAQICPTCRL